MMYDDEYSLNHARVSEGSKMCYCTFKLLAVT